MELPADTLYRLVGVGLSGFAEEGDALAQSDLFAAGFALDAGMASPVDDEVESDG
ncbi:hypothetical protein D3C71_2237630 [compost metagenome]